MCVTVCPLVAQHRDNTGTEYQIGTWPAPWISGAHAAIQRFKHRRDVPSDSYKNRIQLAPGGVC